MTEPTDQLHHRALAGDLRAASEFIGLFYERIYAYFRRLCGNHEDARDLTQETLCKAWASFKSVRNHSSLSGWLHRIAYHLYVDWLRDAAHVVDPSDAWWQTCVPEANTPFDSAAESELASQLHAMVQQLDERAKQVVHLHYYQGLSLKETATVLEVAPGTVKHRLRSALRRLRSQWVDRPSSKSRVR